MSGFENKKKGGNAQNSINEKQLKAFGGVDSGEKKLGSYIFLLKRAQKIGQRQVALIFRKIAL